MTDNIPDEIMQELERLRTNLETRDKFIVSKDLWGEFVAQLDDAARKECAEIARESAAECDGQEGWLAGTEIATDIETTIRGGDDN